MEAHTPTQLAFCVLHAVTVGMKKLNMLVMLWLGVVKFRCEPIYYQPVRAIMTLSSTANSDDIFKRTLCQLSRELLVLGTHTHMHKYTHKQAYTALNSNTDICLYQTISQQLTVAFFCRIMFHYFLLHSNNEQLLLFSSQ